MNLKGIKKILFLLVFTLVIFCINGIDVSADSKYCNYEGEWGAIEFYLPDASFYGEDGRAPLYIRHTQASSKCKDTDKNNPCATISIDGNKNGDAVGFHEDNDLDKDNEVYVYEYETVKEGETYYCPTLHYNCSVKETHGISQGEKYNFKYNNECYFSLDLNDNKRSYPNTIESTINPISKKKPSNPSTPTDDDKKINYCDFNMFKTMVNGTKMNLKSDLDKICDNMINYSDSWITSALSNGNNGVFINFENMYNEHINKFYENLQKHNCTMPTDSVGELTTEFKNKLNEINDEVESAVNRCLPRLQNRLDEIQNEKLKEQAQNGLNDTESDVDSWLKALEKKLRSRIESFGAGNGSMSCGGILGAEVTQDIKEILKWFRIAVPILVIVFSSLDFAKAVLIGDDKALSKATSNLIKRLIIAVAFFFIPTLLNYLLDHLKYTTDCLEALK